MDFAECLRDSIDEVTSQAHAKSQIFEVRIPDHFYILGHADSLAIMLRNFFDNAIKYAPAGSTISVTMDQKGTLEITDQGPGISDDQKSRVFERFTRLDKTGQTGSGLGLSIAQWIAAAHNVRIILKNNTPRGLIVETNWEPAN
jgi:signal transduction histidine kinase